MDGDAPVNLVSNEAETLWHKANLKQKTKGIYIIDVRLSRGFDLKLGEDAFYFAIAAKIVSRCPS